jgi:aspartate carbamoyltransferase catalytic subunit
MPALTCSLPSVPTSIVGLRSSTRAYSLCKYLPQIRRHLRLSSSQVSCLIEADTSVPIEWHEERLKHVVESQQFSQAALANIFATANEMEAIKRGTPAARQLEGYIMSTLFYEPSTRTRLSFESAMSRLGGTVLSTESAGEYSSAAKGETLEGD